MAASLTFSRLFSVTATAAATSSLFPARTISLALSSKFSYSPSNINFHRHNFPKPLRFSSTPSSKSTISATISVGDKLPESTFSYLDAADEVQTTTVSDLTKGKKAILFAVPGAFTPTCSQKHVPGFVEKSTELKAKGVDTIACISVNDAFVMKAWKENLKINDEVLLLSDGNGNCTKAVGCELDLNDKLGLDVRSRWYALLKGIYITRNFDI